MPLHQTQIPSLLLIICLHVLYLKKWCDAEGNTIHRDQNDHNHYHFYWQTLWNRTSCLINNSIMLWYSRFVAFVSAKRSSNNIRLGNQYHWNHYSKLLGIWIFFSIHSYPSENINVDNGQWRRIQPKRNRKRNSKQQTASNYILWVFSGEQAYPEEWIKQRILFVHITYEYD